MAGKKGRSGRKKKIPQIIKPPAPIAPVIPGPVNTGKQETITPPAGDPFLKIEQELKQIEALKTPENAPAPETAKRKPPENLIRAGWKWFYGIEDAIFRAKIGLGSEYRGIFTDNALVEAHVQPSAQLVEKYVPENVMRELDEKTPLIMFLAAFAEGQLALFAKFQQAKKELGGAKPAKPVTPAGEGIKYPSPDELRS